MLLVVLLLGLAETAAELFLLEHYEDWKQIVPLALIGLALVSIVWHIVVPSAANVRVLQALMTLFLFAGAIGMGLHYDANSEFEREMDPSLTGYRLFTESLSGATPLLAPGTMVQLGLIGLVYTYRHPRLESAPIDAGRQEWDV
jgi:hypothetical protein